MVVFVVWFEKCPSKISEGDGLGVGRTWFTKWYTNDISVFNLTLEDHGHRMQEVFERLKVHNLKLHLNKCQFFQT